jgi:erythromycin esterase-like protein
MEDPMTTSIHRNASERRVLLIVTTTLAVGCLTAFVGGASAPAATTVAMSSAELTPRYAIDAILDAFAEYDVVALGEGPHGNEPGHRFRVSLIRDPRFTARVNDIVVEFGNARYQDVMDRYLAGQDVPRESLCRVWRDTTVAGPIWDRPIYEEFFAEMRRLNATLPSERRGSRVARRCTDRLGRRTRPC